MSFLVPAPEMGSGEWCGCGTKVCAPEACYASKGRTVLGAGMNYFMFKDLANVQCTPRDGPSSAHAPATA